MVSTSSSASSSGDSHVGLGDIVIKDVSLSEPSVFQWKGKGVRAPSAHYVTDQE
jgi:hypothetical protein